MLATAIAGSAAAEYNPKLGRFMQRDPNGTTLVLQQGLIQNAGARRLGTRPPGDRQYRDGLHLYGYATSAPITRLDARGLWSLGEHKSITKHALQNLRIPYAHASAREKFIKGVVAGSIYPDVPEGYISLAIKYNREYFEESTTYRSHSGDLMWWHGMAQGGKDEGDNRDRADAVYEKMINRTLDTVDDGWRKGSYDKGHHIGRLLHTIQDSFCPSHTARENGKIVKFLDYAEQDHGEHKKWDKRKNSPLEWEDALDASRKFLAQAVHMNGGREALEKLLREDIFARAATLKIGTWPDR